jgi:hypothetical protein
MQVRNKGFLPLSLLRLPPALSPTLSFLCNELLILSLLETILNG